MARVQIRMSEERQCREWRELYRLIQKVMRRRGKEECTGRGDYWLLDDNWGPEFFQHVLYMFDLRMIAPDIVRSLHRLLDAYPHWEIVVVVALVDKEWPDMGLYIRNHEIIDGLKREYFPPEYQRLQYEGARLGTEKD